MVAVVGYALWLEPRFALGGQSWVWTGRYAVPVLLILVSATVIWKNGSTASSHPISEHDPSPKIDDAESSLFDPRSTILDPQLSWSRRLRWLVLAFVPSSMMLGVTM